MLAENILKTFVFITEDASFVEYKIAFICHFYIFVHNDKREDMQQSLTKLYQKNVWNPMEEDDETRKSFGQNFGESWIHKIGCTLEN